MTILETSKEFTPKEIYMMTQDAAVKSVKDVEDNAVLMVSGFLRFEDTNANGETSEMLSLLGADEDGVVTVWSCQSATFKRSFNDILTCCGVDYDLESQPLAIQKISGETKAGRPFVNCRWA